MEKKVLKGILYNHPDKARMVFHYCDGPHSLGFGYDPSSLTWLRYDKPIKGDTWHCRLLVPEEFI